MPETAAREQSDEEDDASAPFHAPALIRRAQRSSATVQSRCLTFSHRRVGPASYRLACPSRPALRSRARDHLGPCLVAVQREPPHRRDQVLVVDDILQPGAAFTERAPGELPAVVVEQIEHHEHRRRGDGVRVGLAEPVEPRPELLVVDGDLAVEDQGAGRQLRDRRDPREAPL